MRCSRARSFWVILIAFWLLIPSACFASAFLCNKPLEPWEWLYACYSGRDVLLVYQDSLVVYGRPPDDGAHECTAASRRMLFSFPASPEVRRCVARDLQPGLYNFMHGDEPSRWRFGLQMCEVLTIENVSPGLDLQLSSSADALVAEFSSSEAAARAQMLDVCGADEDMIAAILHGLRTGGPFPLFPPHQKGHDRSASKLAGVAEIDWCSHLGGVGQDQVTSMTIGEDGCPVFAGYTRSQMPTPGAPFDPTLSGAEDGFIAKVTESGDAVIWLTYIGGEFIEEIVDICTGYDGSLLACGWTTSDHFPVTAGAFQRYRIDMEEAFVIRVSADGMSLLGATYLGGRDDEEAKAIAEGPDGDILVGGVTWSSNFPVTAGAFDTVYEQGDESFLCRMNYAASTLQWGTLLNTSGVRDIAWRGDGIVIAGIAGERFPATAGALDSTYGGSADAFIAVVSHDGAALTWGTYIGSVYYDHINRVAVLPDGDIVFMCKAGPEFPVTDNAHDRSYNGGYSDFAVGRISASGDSLVWATYWGGSDEEGIRDFAHGGLVIVGDRVVVSDRTLSPDFETTPNALQSSYGGGWDGVLGVFSAATGALVSSSYFGGNDQEGLLALAADGQGNLYGGGYVYVTDGSCSLPITGGVLQPVYSGNSDGFIVKFRNLAVPVLVSNLVSRREAAGVEVTWECRAGESGLVFELWRGHSPGVLVSRLDWLGDGPYLAQDTQAPREATEYRLFANLRSGVSTWYGPVTVSAAEIKRATLLATPNPTAGGTRIQMTGGALTLGALAIHDVRGRQVRLYNDVAPADVILWDGRGSAGEYLPSGLYFASWRLGPAIVTTRITICR